MRQQLIIGQSTLDTVLAAEARLYEAESKSINFASDQYMAEISILAFTWNSGPLIRSKVIKRLKRLMLRPYLQVVFSSLLGNFIP